MKWIVFLKAVYDQTKEPKVSIKYETRKFHYYHATQPTRPYVCVCVMYYIWKPNSNVLTLTSLQTKKKKNPLTSPNTQNLHLFKNKTNKRKGEEKKRNERKGKETKRKTKLQPVPHMS